MLKLKTELPAKRRARLGAVLLAWAFVLLVGALAVERWRGQCALRAWREQNTARGELLDLASLWPKPDELSQKLLSRLANATRQLPTGLADYSASIYAMVPEEPGLARRGSQELQPVGVKGRSWQQLATVVGAASEELKNLREVMKQVPASMGDDIVERMETGATPGFVGARVSAQTLHAVAIHELHQGNLSGALDNLVSLSAAARIFADEPSLVSYMVRVSIAGLSVDAFWDALQAPGWTEQQLAQLQQAMNAFPTLNEMPRVVEAERAARLASWEWFHSHSYYAWMDRYGEIAKGFGAKIPDTVTAGLARKWQQWGFHPLWQFAWADQEKHEYLEHSQKELAAMREAVALQSWRHLEARLKSLEREYRPPTAQWRFHRRLPLYDDLFMIVGSSRPAEPVCPHPSYHRAWRAAFKNLTQIQLVRVAIALKRFSLRHGKYPPSLEVLVPEFLPARPFDFMDGEPLRYRLNLDRTFTLYSVGEDATDNGGDPFPISTERDNSYSPWNSQDWVWPEVAADEQPGA